MSETLFSGQPGPKGDRGETGARGDPFLTRRKAWAVVYLFGLAVVLSVVALFWINHEVHVSEAAQQRQAQKEALAQRRAGLLIERAICTDVGTMAKIPPPAGQAATNPSRGYEQDEHTAWAGLYAGLGCSK